MNGAKETKISAESIPDDMQKRNEDYGHWQTKIQFNPTDYYGFVYLVTNIATGRMYIGKRSMWSNIRKAVKGRRNRKRLVVESNWRSYTTSSTQINKEILEGQQFKYEILSLHKSKSSLGYAEVEQMILRDVLRKRFKDGERVYYNAIIPAIKYIPKID
jgi:hypothetical protein